jgi:2-hydroxychromene-2-carboxylate isomerase
MRNRTRVIAAAAAVTAAITGGSAAAIASTTNAKTGTPAKLVSTIAKQGGSKTAPSEKQGHDAIVAAVARELHLSTARVSAALQPLFAAGHADTSSPSFVAAARSLGVSTQQLFTALMHAKESLAGGTQATKNPGGSKTAKGASKTASSESEKQNHDAMVASVARQLHVSTARVKTALQPLFAAGHADTSSPSFVAAARSLGVSIQQLATALMHAKESLAGGS